MSRASSLPFLLFFIPALLAQDAYLLPERFTLAPGESCELALHGGDFFPASEYATAVEALTRGRLSTGAALRGWQEAGDRTVTQLTAPARAGSFYAAVETQAQLRELEADDFEAYLADEGAMETIEWRSRQGEARRPGRELIRRSAKTLLTAGEAGGAVEKPLGQPLEIVPLKNPALLRAGEVLPLRVVFRGAALRGVLVNVRWVDASGKMGSLAAGPTDARGGTSVRLEAGVWKLHALRLMRRVDRREADWDTYSASLTFEVRSQR